MKIHELAEKLKKKEISSMEITESYLKKIARLNPKLNCYISVASDVAKAEAKASDKRRAQGETLGILDGIPIGLKDIFLTKALPTTCGSKILADYQSPYEGTTARVLREAGAVLLGKLNMDEFAMGSSNEHSAFGACSNPWDLESIPGGSSGGCAAAVAADLCVASMGTDTGGSIRQPASLCGITGLKPTYGRVTRYGIVSFASSLDQAGPMTKDVHDAAILLNYVAGFDLNDSTSLNIETPDFTRSLGKGVKRMKVGIPKEYFIEGITPEVKQGVESAIRQYEELGVEIQEVSLPHTKYAVPAYYIIAPAEASANLARYDGVRFGYRSKEADTLEALYKKTRGEGFGPEVALRIVLGTYVLSSGFYDAYYLKAQKVRTLIKNDFLKVFEKVDCLLTPTAPTVAFKKGEKTEDPVQMYLNDIFTIPVNLAGLPGISIPCGFSSNNLPIGMQLIAPHLEEEKLFQLGDAYQQITDWHMRSPEL